MQSFSKVSIEANISKNVFIPKPNVDSCIIKIVKKNNSLPFDKFSDFIREAFKQRRKKLKNNLKGFCDLNYLESHKDQRPEELSPNEYLNLFNKIYF